MPVCIERLLPSHAEKKQPRPVIVPGGEPLQRNHADAHQSVPVHPDAQACRRRIRDDRAREREGAVSVLSPSWHQQEPSPQASKETPRALTVFFYPSTSPFPAPDPCAGRDKSESSTEH